MESMLISNTSDNIVTDAQQEEWRKDQKRQKILPSRISTERNSSKHIDVQTQALTDNVEATCDILAPVINLLLSLDNREFTIHNTASWTTRLQDKREFKIYDAAGSTTRLRKKEICHARQKL